jgi:outer membrane protein assembly factor BamE (lipoprotein component of BamABCDE complex)
MIWIEISKSMRATILLLSCVALAGCASAGYHRDQVRDETVNALTVGTVQREIQVGMSADQVIEKLGSPNVVTTDEQRREVWVYDKVASDVSYSQSGGSLIFVGGSSGAKSSSQRTLTVIIKFDEAKKVRDFAYNQSRF